MTKKKKYAYVWLLMYGDKYLAGIIASIYSLKKTKTKYDILIMVTKDVSDKAKNILKKMGKIKNIDYIKNSIKLLTKRQEEKYSSWINAATTKWNCLSFIEYDKVLFLDADTLITKNIDYLFNYETPGGCFYNPWSNIFNKKSKVKDYYGKKRIITPNMIKKSLYGYGYVFIASCVLISPNIEDFKKFKKMLKKKLNFRNYSAPDEISLTYYYSIYNNGPKKNWKRLSDCHQFIPFRYKENECTKGKKFSDKVKIIHIFGDLLPWESSEKEINNYDDVPIWISFFRAGLKYYKINFKNVYMKYPEIILNYKYDKKDIFHKHIKL